MHLLESLAPKLWKDPVIRIPLGTSRESVTVLMDELNAWDINGNLKVVRDLNKLFVSFENPVTPFERGAKRKYLLPLLETFLRREFNLIKQTKHKNS